MQDAFRTLLQYCLPQHLLSRAVGIIANCQWRWFKNWAIRRLIRKYHVDIHDAASTCLDDYPSFNHFFTRQLKPNARPIATEPHSIVSPADGTVSQCGKIQTGTLFQAKNFYFNTEKLLGGATDYAKLFNTGSFATFYLAPRDYHRVHMPFDGTLTATIYIPGKLFSVNPLTTASVPELFARNERLVCLFETTAGPMAVILVGAMLVGQMQTVWDPAPYAKEITIKQTEKIFLKKGAELGHFKMGSTVIILFGSNDAKWQSTLQPNSCVKMGEQIGMLEQH